MSYYTYAHYTIDTKEIFYIGKGTFSKQGNFKRAYAKTGRNAYWKNKVNKHQGFKVKILAVWDTEEESFSHERLLISCFEGKLVNLTEGGEGCFGRKQSQEEKNKRADSNRGQKRNPQTLQRMSEAQKKNSTSLEVLKTAREKQKKKVFCFTTKVTYSSLREASINTGIIIQNISKCCLGKRKHAGGLSWKYLND
jgi:hypothetical protein